jgi:hypothetical protein
LSYLQLPKLSKLTSDKEVLQHCGSLFLSLDYPNLILFAFSVLDTNGSAPFGYAHAAKAIMKHIRGPAILDRELVVGNYNYFDLARYLARKSCPLWLKPFWYAKHLLLAWFWPASKPLPLP